MLLHCLNAKNYSSIRPLTCSAGFHQESDVVASHSAAHLMTLRAPKLRQLRGVSTKTLYVMWLTYSFDVFDDLYDAICRVSRLVARSSRYCGLSIQSGIHFGSSSSCT